MRASDRGWVVSVLAVAAGAGLARAQAFTEHFDDITALVPGGWFMQNNSAPGGTTGWFQGSAAIFPAQSGAPAAYIAANYANTSGNNTISNWLLTPERTLHDGDVLTFWTRTESVVSFPDRLEVRLSTNGTSTNVGSAPTDVGDFGVVLVTINPDLTATGYPTAWTQFTVTVSGAGASASGRFAFRYYVTNGGPQGSNSAYIGIDEVAFTPGAGTLTGACCTGGVCTPGVTQASCTGGGGTYLGNGSTCAAGCGGGTCYANCDHSTTVPFLNVQDFSCFLTKFVSSDPYANCDNSTSVPTLNVQDFSCYLTKFATGCSAP